jgi:hypothetical protein
MRLVAATLALAMCLLGCRSEVPFPIAADVYYVGADQEGCSASTYLVGVLVIDRDRLVIQDDHGVSTSLTWRGTYSARQLAGGEVEVMNGWTVVATTGHR